MVVLSKNIFNEKTVILYGYNLYCIIRKIKDYYPDINLSNYNKETTVKNN